MTRRSGNRFSPLISIAVVLLVLIAIIYLVSAIPVDALSEVRFRHLPVWTIPALVIMHMAYLLLAAEVWRQLVFAVAGVRGAFGDAYLQMVSAAIGKYVPGKIWGIVARTAQLHRVGVPAQMSIVSSVAEQLIVFLGGGIVATCAAFVVFPDYRPIIATAGIASLVGLTFLPRFLPVIVGWIQRRRGEAETVTSDLECGIGHWLKFTIAHVVMWVTSGAILCVIYFSVFDAALTVEGVAALILANTIGFIVGFLAIFAPGGLGVREATTVAILAPFLPVREALIAAVALRAWIVLFDGINCGIMLIAELRNTARYLK
jgi:uncharacterized membrane protein YbhN (UPF0104 family)